ncbi:alpha/beta fold hydrolase [Streptomyces sp. cg36]|uniref:alpha/beta hydrolase n=1 Tax=Streptomyces sp. cg36 TaxID=3238798 RepID=UPI0034E27EFF
MPPSVLPPPVMPPSAKGSLTRSPVRFLIRSVRPVGRLLAAAAVVVGLAALFLALIVATDGAGSGFAAWSATVGAALAAAAWRGRRRPWRGRLVPFVPVLVAAALTLTVCVPTVPTTRRSPSALAFVTTEHWRLSTGSRVAVYHYPPTGGGPRRHVPLLYLNGGPVRGISVLDHHFLRRLAGQGYDVYAYEQAGGGRSDLLPMDQYTITRSVRDLRAFVDRLGTERVDVLGFSSGAALLARAGRPGHRRPPAPCGHRRAGPDGRPHRPAHGAEGPTVGPRHRTGEDGTALHPCPAVRGRVRPDAARPAQPGERAGGTGGGRQRLHRRGPRQRHRVRVLREGRAPHPGRGHGGQLLLQRRRQPPHPANDQGLPLPRPAAEALPGPRDADDRRVLVPGPPVGDNRPRQRPRHPAHPVHARRRPPHVERPGRQRPASGGSHHGIPPGQAGTTARLSDPGGHSGFSGGATGRRW